MGRGCVFNWRGHKTWGITDFNDGIRLRHWVDQNSVKIYNEQNNLRVETTINNPGKFKVFHHKQGQDKNEPKQRLPMRKGVMDTLPHTN